MKTLQEMPIQVLGGLFGLVLGVVFSILGAIYFPPAPLWHYVIIPVGSALWFGGIFYILPPPPSATGA